MNSNHCHNIENPECYVLDPVGECCNDAAVLTRRFLQAMPGI